MGNLSDAKRRIRGGPTTYFRKKCFYSNRHTAEPKDKQTLVEEQTENVDEIAPGPSTRSASYRKLTINNDKLLSKLGSSPEEKTENDLCTDTEEPSNLTSFHYILIDSRILENI